MLQRVAVQSTRVLSRRAGVVVAARSYTESGSGRASHSKGFSYVFPLSMTTFFDVRAYTGYSFHVGSEKEKAQEG